MTVGKPDTLTFRWLTGILVSMVLALVGFWAHDLSAQVGALGAVVRDNVVATAVVRGALTETNARLKRIEDNQDAATMSGRRR